mmetsp:Transcript_221/g.924  ORF Transcript_221/g.924 Transcript_221/m.924 type:complete len:232 (-) Transcript_221:660-1355(-)
MHLWCQRRWPIRHFQGLSGPANNVFLADDADVLQRELQQSGEEALQERLPDTTEVFDGVDETAFHGRRFTESTEHLRSRLETLFCPSRDVRQREAPRPAGAGEDAGQEHQDSVLRRQAALALLDRGDLPDGRLHSCLWVLPHPRSNRPGSKSKSIVKRLDPAKLVILPFQRHSERVSSNLLQLSRNARFHGPTGTCLCRPRAATLARVGHPPASASGRRSGIGRSGIGRRR